MTQALHDSASHPIAKVIFGFFVAVIAAFAGYLVVYYWTFHNFSDVFNVSVLKSQIIANQNAKDVKSQLTDLGYDFKDEDLFQLNNPSSTNYKADVLGGYEPVKVAPESVTEQGYYFYDHNGTPFYFKVDANNKIIPESVIPLMVH